MFRDSIVVSISACHADDPGSIPGRGVIPYGLHIEMPAHGNIRTPGIEPGTIRYLLHLQSNALPTELCSVVYLLSSSLLGKVTKII